MNIKQIYVATIAIFTFSMGAMAGEYTHSTPAVQGYDVVLNLTKWIVNAKFVASIFVALMYEGCVCL